LLLSPARGAVLFCHFIYRLLQGNLRNVACIPGFPSNVF
jgi:hypothetical protein